MVRVQQPVLLRRLLTLTFADQSVLFIACIGGVCSQHKTCSSLTKQYIAISTSFHFVLCVSPIVIIIMIMFKRDKINEVSTRRSSHSQQQIVTFEKKMKNDIIEIVIEEKMHIDLMKPIEKDYALVDQQWLVSLSICVDEDDCSFTCRVKRGESARQNRFFHFCS